MRYASIVLLFVCSHVNAECWPEDRVTQGFMAATAVLSVVDWAQTRGIADNPSKFYEKGFAQNFIGKHPTTREVNQYFVTSLALTYGIGCILPERMQKLFYIGATLNEAAAVQNNIEVGVKAEF